MSTPAGPYDLNPIAGINATNNFTDFRPKAPAQTAFEMHQQKSAFAEEQRAVDDAQADADELFGTGEPETAFQLEARGGRAPLGATESAKDSPEEPTRPAADTPKAKSATPATAEKGKPQPAAPKPLPTS